MKVWIIYRDVDYECGYVVDVLSSRKKAEAELAKILNEKTIWGIPKSEEYSIEEWKVD